jgi:DNA-binding response OmpR family regulator
LATRHGAPVSRVDLIREAWGMTYDGGSNKVDVVIRGLRRKLGRLADRIETVRGVGYRLR